jgi:hypothetical protein
MTMDYYAQAIHESETRQAMRRWTQARIEGIRKRVSAHDLLRRNGIKLRYSVDREEQFACPFHGVDRHPSARVYPETVKGPSHVWCFTCHENWDVFKLWSKFSGGESKFTRVLGEIEREFGIIPPERPPTAAEMADYVDPATLRIEQMLVVCECRLRWAKEAFDMRAHLMIGAVLDRVRYRFEHGQLAPDRTVQVLQQVLKKIGAREIAYHGATGLASEQVRGGST